MRHFHTTYLYLVCSLLFVAGLGACNSQGPSDRVLPPAAASADYDWPHYANDLRSSKYADLSQIDAANVRDLEEAWLWNSPDNAMVEANPELTPISYKSTPIKIGNRLYINTSLGQVAALDAVSGEQIWLFDTHTYDDGRPANMGFNSRGVAYWEADGMRRILVGTNNAYLWSIDADTGLPDRTFGNNGRIDLTEGLERPVERRLYSVVAAPLVVGDTVILGSVVFDLPVYTYVTRKLTDLPPGHVRGFDVRSGKQKWLFHSIPQPGEVGNETWEEGSWAFNGSTNVWTMMSADPELGYVYLPFGTPSNDWYGGHRPGHNLFAESVVCIEAATGKYVWHFQTVHHGLWDYDLPAAPNLVDITVDGKPVKALAQISKQAFVYVLDRTTGEPIWPIEERPVPQSSIPGENSAATQPFPTRPAPFDVQGIGEDTLIDFTPELKAEALKIINRFDHGPLFTPPSFRGTIQIPGDGGGGEWTGAAYDPDTGMFYIPSNTRPIVVQLIEPEAGTTEYRYVRGGVSSLRGPQRLPITKPPYSRTSALNLNTGDYEWVVPNGEGIRQKLIDMGIPDPGPVGQMNFSSPLLTRSLLFLPMLDGTEPVLRAMDKTTGEKIYDLPLPDMPTGAPMTYMVNGKQYISLALGTGKHAKLVGIALR